MFRFNKQDYYTANANISLSPTRQRQSESIGKEEGNSRLMRDSFPQASLPSIFARDMSAEMMPTYEQVYYPRTDKRVISKREKES